MSANAIHRLPACSVDDLLAELDELRARARAGESIAIPSISVRLDGGHVVRGDLVGRTRTGSLLLADPERFEATYVQPDAIRAVTVHLSPETLHLVSFGKLRPPQAEAPGRLELERSLRDLSEALSEALGSPIAAAAAWDELPGTDEARGALAALVADLRITLLSLARDELGGPSLRERVKRLEIHLGKIADATLHEGVLTLHVVPDDGDLEILRGVPLRETIERLL